MGQAVDTVALANCIRTALYAHLGEYVEGEETTVTVYEGEGQTVVLDVNGFFFDLVLKPAGQADSGRAG